MFIHMINYICLIYMTDMTPAFISYREVFMLTFNFSPSTSSSGRPQSIKSPAIFEVFWFKRNLKNHYFFSVEFTLLVCLFV